jgi:hypothetical protein
MIQMQMQQSSPYSHPNPHQHVQSYSQSYYTIVIGLNPALQKRFILSSKTPFLTPGNVHRAVEIQQGIGGKGQDVYVALHCLSSFTTSANVDTGVDVNAAVNTSMSTDMNTDVDSDIPSGKGTGNSNSMNDGRNKNTNISSSSNSSNRSNSDTNTISNNTEVSRGIHNVKLAQFLGKGAEGDAVLSYFLNNFEKDMDLSLTIRTEEKLRVCTTIVNCEEDYVVRNNSNENSNHKNKNNDGNDNNDSTTAGGVGGSTELIEPSGTIKQDEVEELRHALKTLMMESNNNRDADDEASCVRGICIMGSMPPGCPSGLYAELYRSIISKQVTNGNDNIPLCMLDTVVGLDHLFHEMNVHRNLAKKTNMIKINMAELCKITGTNNAVCEVANADINQVRQAMKGLYQKFPESKQALNYVAITNGMFPAFMVHVNNSFHADEKTKEDIIYRFTVPMLSQLHGSDRNNDVTMGGTQKLYTIGAGDAVTASTLAAWEYLTNKKGDQRLDEAIRASLLKSFVFGEDKDMANTAFAFGLACGTASCIEKENSVFDIPNALQLFEQMERPHRMK